MASLSYMQIIGKGGIHNEALHRKQCTNNDDKKKNNNKNFLQT